MASKKIAKKTSTPVKPLDTPIIDTPPVDVDTPPVDVKLTPVVMSDETIDFTDESAIDNDPKHENRKYSKFLNRKMKKTIEGPFDICGTKIDKDFIIPDHFADNENFMKRIVRSFQLGLLAWH